MKETEDCFLKVKRNYLSFLNKEKIFNQSKTVKIKNLRKIYIPMSFWIDKKYKKREQLYFWVFQEVKVLEKLL